MINEGRILFVVGLLLLPTLEPSHSPSLKQSPPQTHHCAKTSNEKAKTDKDIIEVTQKQGQYESQPGESQVAEELGKALKTNDVTVSSEVN